MGLCPICRREHSPEVSCVDAPVGRASYIKTKLAAEESPDLEINRMRKRGERNLGLFAFLLVAVILALFWLAFKR